MKMISKMWVFLCLLYCNSVYAQIEAGVDTFVCQGQSVVLNASGVNTYTWDANPTLNSLTINNPTASPTVTTTYFVSALGTDIVVNGNFNTGNTNFISSYGYDASSVFDEGSYSVAYSPNDVHNFFCSASDHTTGSGKMFVANGSSLANTIVWEQTIPVIPNTQYRFSTWVMTINTIAPLNPAVMQFSINGVLLGTPFNAPNSYANWQQFYETWDSGSSTSAVIRIVNQNTEPNGNDFALDDIFFQPEYRDSVTVTVYPNPIAAITAPADICAGSTVALFNAASSAVADTPEQQISSYNWSFGDGNSSNGIQASHTFITPGVYTIALQTTTDKGCVDNTTASIEAISCEIIIPNVITPNGDDKNDKFVMKGLEYFNNSHLVVYNRWGNKVYENTNYQNDWDGGNCTEGTYYYLLTLIDDRTFNGIISILK